jgi:hypothetical protein
MGFLKMTTEDKLIGMIPTIVAGKIVMDMSEPKRKKKKRKNLFNF